MIPDEILKERGYNGYKVSKTSSYPLADYHFQKRFRNEGATLYFVNVYQYYPKSIGQFDYEGGSKVEVNLYPSVTDNSEWITLVINGAKDLDYVETFIHNAYQKLEMIPDIHNM